MANVMSVYTKKNVAPPSPINNNQPQNLLSGAAASISGSATFPANTLQAGGIIRLTAWGSLRTTADPGTVQMTLKWGRGNVLIGGTLAVRMPPNQGFMEWEFFAMITLRPPADAPQLVCEGFFYCPSISTNTILPRGSIPIGIENPNIAGRLNQFAWVRSVANELQLIGQLSVAAPNQILVLEQCSIEYLPPGERLARPPEPQGVGAGTVNGSTTTLPLAGTYTGKLSASAVYGSTLYAATAFQDLGTVNNTQAATFTYGGAEGGGGVAVGTRWSDLGQEGDFAYVDTNSTPPVIRLIRNARRMGARLANDELIPFNHERQ